MPPWWKVSRGALRRPSWRALALVALLVAVLDQLGRPLPAYWPRRDPDASWMVGLQMIRDQDLPYGAGQVFTYGPWGFLSAPTGIDLSDLWLAGAFRAGVLVVLFLGIRSCLPSLAWRTPIAGVMSLLIANCSQAGWVLALGLCAIVLGCLATSRTPGPWLLSVASCLSALAVQVKFSDGAFAVAVVGLLALVTWRPRLWLLSSLVFVASSVVLWVGAGQSLAELGEWLRLGVEIVGGYAEGMAFISTSWIVWTLVVAIVVAGVGVLGAKGLPVPARFAAVGILLYMTKTGMTRPDGPHILPAYAGVLLVLVVVLAAGSVPGKARLLVVPVAAALSLLMLVNSPLLPPRNLSPSTLPLDALPTHHDVRLSQVRADLVADLAIGQDVLSALDQHPVTIDPWEISAAWAHDLDWRPLPVFQNYSAYTPRLDTANADALLADADIRVLRESLTYARANRLWESPAYTLALTCNFQSELDDGHWAVYARVPVRCGAEQRLSSTRIGAGDVIDLPEPEDAIVAVRFEPDERSVGDRLLGGLTGVQRHLLHANLDGVEHQLPEALAGGPLIVGASPGTEGALFEIGAAATISFDRAGVLEIVEIPLTGRESE